MNEEAKKQISDGLLTAIKAEQDGYHFYLMAAHNTGDPQAKEVFEQLAQEELDHNRFLKHQYQAILDTGAPDPKRKLGHRVDLSGHSPIFSPALKARIDQAHFEMSSLSIAVQLELSAMNFYKAQAAEADDPTVQSFFEELANWESGHYHALLRQQETLRDDYWKGGGFSPF